MRDHSRLASFHARGQSSGMSQKLKLLTTPAIPEIFLPHAWGYLAFLQLLGRLLALGARRYGYSGHMIHSTMQEESKLIKELRPACTYKTKASR